MPKPKNLVISGGGISGLGIIGILKYLNEKNLLVNIDNYIGTSVGSIICFFLSLDFNINELIEFVCNFDFSKILDNLDIDNLFDKWGFSNSEKLEYLIMRMIQIKNINSDITFKEHFELTGKNLIITGTCLNESKAYYFNHERNPNMKILLAICISCAVPVVFEPIKYDDKLWLDGGIIDNYPINYFEDEIDFTLGITVTEKYFEKKKNDINELNDFLLSIFKCGSYVFQNYMIDKFKDNTIKLTNDISSFGNFKLDEKERIKMVEYGYVEANKQNEILEQFFIEDETFISSETSDSSIEMILLSSSDESSSDDETS